MTDFDLHKQCLPWSWGSSTLKASPHSVAGILDSPSRSFRRLLTEKEGHTHAKETRMDVPSTGLTYLGPCRTNGNRIVARMFFPVKAINCRSTPPPTPPEGGMAYSKA